MYLPRRLLPIQLRRIDCGRQLLKYQDQLVKIVNCKLRIEFLENCKKADIIPKFLKFRIPQNGCFDNKAVHEFQRKLLHKELITAKRDLNDLNHELKVKREIVKNEIPHSLLPSIVVYTRLLQHEHRTEGRNRHNQKLCALAEEQERPLFNVSNTVRLLELKKTPPAYVIETLSLGPRSPVLNKFDSKEVLATLDEFLHHCKNNCVDDEVITDINVKTLNYVKKCKQLRNSRNVMLTNKYLKENDLLAVPFDKGVGICVMSKETYTSKIKAITDLPQFEKYIDKRSNARHPVFIEEDRVCNKLEELYKQDKFSKVIYDRLTPVGSQLPRLYGLAKVHKPGIPLRPVLSMPGSAYYEIAKQIAVWLSLVPECQINCSTESIVNHIKKTKLEKEEILVSFDVVSLYTNVPVLESINICANLLFDKYKIGLPVDKDTFIELALLASCNVVMSTADGFYRQTEGLAMGSPCAPLLANGWLSQYDSSIQDNARIYFRYMDDVIREIKGSMYESKLTEINSLHKSLKFTGEKEKDNAIPVLDTKLINKEGTLSATWYFKPSDTGLIMNFHALAPVKYKRATVIGFVHRIYRACSDWFNFNESIERAKDILLKNQYPPSFTDKYIRETISKIVNKEQRKKEDENTEKPYLLFLQYRGKSTEKYASDIKKTGVAVKLIFTLRKLKTVTPSLKEPVIKSLKSGVVYKLTCPRCNACYVGATTRHLQTRVKEHRTRKKQTVYKHLEKCNSVKDDLGVDILGVSIQGEVHLFTLEALWIRQLKPQINVRDEFKSRELVIKF